LTAPAASEAARPSLLELFACFLEMAMSGFGGVLAWAHRSLVERRGWLSEREFASLLALSQVLPGGNVINLAVFVGLNYQGMRGVLVALAGLLLAPFTLLLLLGAFVANPAVGEITRPALRGAAPVVAGLVLATAIKMARPYRASPRALGLAALSLTAVGILQVPLLITLLVLGPLGIALAWRRPI
jgi:chromate transporter